jgi:CBS domain-containing protein
MDREVPRVEADAGIDEVQRRMAADRARLMAVFSGERFLGLVSREDLNEALSILMFTARREAA